MRPRSGGGARWVLGWLLGMVATGAAAQTSARVAVCPWEVGASARELAGPAKETGQRVAEELLDTASASELESALQSGRCADSVEDLAPLAVRARAAYALHARVEARPGLLQLHWRLVSRAGRLVASSAATQPFEARGAEADGRAALERLAARFYAEQVKPRLASLPMESSAAEDPPEPQAVKAPAAPPPAEARGQVPWRWVGVGAAVAGAVSLGASGAITMSAQGDREELKALLDAQGSRPDEPRARALSESLRDRGGWATGTLIAGGALLGAGALMVLSAPRAELVPTASVSADGVAFSLTGKF